MYALVYYVLADVDGKNELSEEDPISYSAKCYQVFQTLDDVYRVVDNRQFVTNPYIYYSVYRLDNDSLIETNYGPDIEKRLGPVDDFLPELWPEIYCKDQNYE